jgi:hypothetical protein
MRENPTADDMFYSHCSTQHPVFSTSPMLITTKTGVNLGAGFANRDYYLPNKTSMLDYPLARLVLIKISSDESVRPILHNVVLQQYNCK